LPKEKLVSPIGDIHMTNRVISADRGAAGDQEIHPLASRNRSAGAVGPEIQTEQIG
jgi:hypothetical protein